MGGIHFFPKFMVTLTLLICVNNSWALLPGDSSAESDEAEYGRQTRFDPIHPVHGQEGGVNREITVKVNDLNELVKTMASLVIELQEKISGMENSGVEMRSEIWMMKTKLEDADKERVTESKKFEVRMKQVEKRTTSQMDASDQIHAIQAHILGHKNSTAAIFMDYCTRTLDEQGEKKEKEGNVDAFMKDYNLCRHHINFRQLSGRAKDILDSVRPRSCAAHHPDQNETDTTTIYPFGRLRKPVQVRCDFDTDGGNWTVIQRRRSGPKEEFFLDWPNYEEGFGSATGNYWIGLKAMHALTSLSSAPQELRVDLEDWEGNRRFAKYTSFSVGSGADRYKLGIGGYSGNAGNSMGANNGMPFTTRDRDNDDWPINCAEARHGAWWFSSSCSDASLNGYYYPISPSPDNDGILWYAWRGFRSSLKSTEMKIRDVVTPAA